jgi:putative aldouronate transport system permease protein
MYGIIIAFKDYKPALGILGSPWAQPTIFKHFLSLIEPRFGSVIRNTLIISSLNLVFGFPAPILFALLLNEIKSVNYKKVVQTISYVPHFVSWIVISAIAFVYFAPANGVLNVFLRNLGLVDKSIGFLESGPLFIVMMVLLGIWKELGWSAIIYLAAIAGIDEELYEAATVDGAKSLQKVRYITLPCILPTIVVLLILSIASILNAGFDQQMIMANDLVWDWADVIDTYAYRYGLKMLRYSYGTAVGLFKSVISCLLLFGSNWLSRRVSGMSLYS